MTDDPRPEPRLRHVQCLAPEGLHHMAYWEWGDAANPKVLVCVHGLTRQGRDFDTLARELAGQYRVVCPDVVGRGESDWMKNPASYAIPTYVADMVTLLARLDAREVHWLGTSMGGLIGLGLAALPESPIRRLVLNDVGTDDAVLAGHRAGQRVEVAPLAREAVHAHEHLGVRGVAPLPVRHAMQALGCEALHVAQARFGRGGGHARIVASTAHPGFTTSVGHYR